MILPTDVVASNVGTTFARKALTTQNELYFRDICLDISYFVFSFV